ncbi:shikimate dehydrogenase family protein [Pseudaquabacterium rugosum]|uniref:Shikimate dehydrogenase n=1 Tax=Pseudaquabacterium rugosum TaxID=2984194 RepID=A0ABU9BAB1_9BURK
MITGKTGVFFMVADPIFQVRTPEIFNTVLPLCGVDAVMVPLHVTPDNLVETVRAVFKSPSTRGMVLSIPHKAAAAELVDVCSKRARTANAVNAIRRNASGQLEGEMFDGFGFAQSMDRYRLPYRGRRVLLIGAGGAACAIATALAEGEAAHLGIFDIDGTRSHLLAQAIHLHYGLSTQAQADNDPTGFDVVINCSPMGLRLDDPVPVPVDKLAPGMVVADILMKNMPTPLLRSAMVQGLPVLPGFDMLILQTPLFLDYFGLTEVADVLRRDDSAVRDMLFPEALRHLVTDAR